jgi:hypothetical protein
MFITTDGAEYKIVVCPGHISFIQLDIFDMVAASMSV